MPKMKNWRANSSTKTVGTLTGYYKKQNMKDNVTITEEQIDINTKAWCSFNIRPKNQTFFKTTQHKPHTRYKKQLREMELEVAADNVSSKCKPKLQMFFTQVCRPLNCHYVSFPFSLTCWCYFCESVFVHCDFVFDLFYFEVCVWFLFCCKPCSLHFLKYPPQLLSESSSVLWLFVYFSVVPFSSCIFHAADSRIFPDSH